MKTRRKREPMNRESCLRPLDLSNILVLLFLFCSLRQSLLNVTK